MIELKTSEQIETMHEANKIVHEILGYAELIASIGMSSKELDFLMSEKLNTYSDTKSAFLGYRGYPNVSCISVNSEVVHGIPNEITFKEGDLVSVDFGVYYKGFAGDSARSFIIGKPKSDDHVKIIKDTRQALFDGIEQMVIGNRLHDIGRAIENVAKTYGYGNVKYYSGHGIGKRMHEPPSVFNYIEPREPNIRLQEGLVLALEPMFTLGSGETTLLDDNWTVKTSDGSIAVHWELSIAVTNNGPKILGHGFQER